MLKGTSNLCDFLVEDNERKECSEYSGTFRDMINSNNKATNRARTVRTAMVMRDDRLHSQGTVRQARIDFLKLRKFVSIEKDKKNKEKAREKEVVRGADLTGYNGHNGHTGCAGRYDSIHFIRFVHFISMDNLINWW